MVFVLIGLKILTWTRQSQEFKSTCHWPPLLNDPLTRRPRDCNTVMSSINSVITVSHLWSPNCCLLLAMEISFNEFFWAPLSGFLGILCDTGKWSLLGLTEESWGRPGNDQDQVWRNILSPVFITCVLLIFHLPNMYDNTQHWTSF